MFGRRYFGARHFGPRYFGDGGAGEAAADVVDHRRFRRRYFVRREDQLFFFDDPFEAQEFERAMQPAPAAPQSKKQKRRQLRIVKAAQSISLPAAVESAPAVVKSQMQEMIEQAQWARLMQMVAELEEEDELELLLLSL